jgi:N-acetylglucosamine-6-phosphate deacetylase
MTTLVGDIVTPSGVLRNSSIEIGDSGEINGVYNNAPSSADHDYSGLLIAPGFIDIHVHGGGGSDFMDGTVEAVRTVARTHARHGTTSLLATTLTASREDIERAIDSIISVMHAPRNNEAHIAGIHLEGPYICAKKRGAQPLSAIRPPDVDELAQWIELAAGHIKKITMAPELPGATQFIQWATAQGVAVSIGHTDADCATVESAVVAGATQATHLFNAMSPLTSRSPGAVGALMASAQVMCEIICDGVHVAPQVVKIAVHAKGDSGIVLITDAMSGASMPDGVYSLGGQKVNVAHGTAMFDDGTLAGSVLTMNQAFMNIMSFADVDTCQASTMGSLNGARAIGLESTNGSIEPGKYADLVVLDPLTGRVEATFLSGKLIFAR